MHHLSAQPGVSVVNGTPNHDKPKYFASLRTEDEAGDVDFKRLLQKLTARRITIEDVGFMYEYGKYCFFYLQLRDLEDMGSLATCNNIEDYSFTMLSGQQLADALKIQHEQKSHYIAIQHKNENHMIDDLALVNELSYFGSVIFWRRHASFKIMEAKFLTRKSVEKCVTHFETNHLPWVVIPRVPIRRVEVINLVPRSEYQTGLNPSHVQLNSPPKYTLGHALDRSDAELFNSRPKLVPGHTDSSRVAQSEHKVANALKQSVSTDNTEGLNSSRFFMTNQGPTPSQFGSLPSWSRPVLTPILQRIDSEVLPEDDFDNCDLDKGIIVMGGDMGDEDETEIKDLFKPIGPK